MVLCQANNLVLLALLSGVAAPVSQAEILTAVQTVSVSVAPLGRVTLPTETLLAPSGTAFSAFRGTLPFTYRARTSSGGTGSITVQSSGDFLPSGGPSVEEGMLTFTCSSDGYGTPCSGTQTVSATAQRTVLTLKPASCTGGGNGCSASDPAAATLSFSLQNPVSLETGAFTVGLVFTISYY